MTERWVPQIMCKTGCLDNLYVEPMKLRRLRLLIQAILSEAASDLSDLVRMLLASMKNVELAGTYNLCDAS